MIWMLTVKMVEKHPFRTDLLIRSHKIKLKESMRMIYKQE